MRYEIIENICYSVVDKINQYEEYIVYLAVVILIVGLMGIFFNFIPILSDHRVIIMYCDAGISIGVWLLLIYITYKIYSIWKLLVLLAPLIVYGITYIIKEKEEIKMNIQIFGTKSATIQRKQSVSSRNAELNISLST